MDNPCTVRRADSADSAVLVSHNCAMARETETKELDPQVVAEGVLGLFARPAYGFYLVAERAGAIVGSLMVTPEWSDWRNGFFWWIQSVYVDPAHRRTGVYRALHDHVRSEAAGTEEVRGLRLYVEGENARAQDVYRRLGMAETTYRLYEELLGSPDA